MTESLKEMLYINLGPNYISSNKDEILKRFIFGQTTKPYDCPELDSEAEIASTKEERIINESSRLFEMRMLKMINLYILKLLEKRRAKKIKIKFMVNTLKIIYLGKLMFSF